MISTQNETVLEDKDKLPEWSPNLLSIGPDSQPTDDRPLNVKELNTIGPDSDPTKIEPEQTNDQLMSNEASGNKLSYRVTEAVRKNSELLRTKLERGEKLGEEEGQRIVNECNTLVDELTQNIVTTREKLYNVGTLIILAIFVVSMVSAFGSLMEGAYSEKTRDDLLLLAVTLAPQMMSVACSGLLINWNHKAKVDKLIKELTDLRATARGRSYRYNR